MELSTGDRLIVSIKGDILVLRPIVKLSKLKGIDKMRPIPIVDALIAACASLVDAKVVTDDEHFKETDVEVMKFRYLA